MKRVIITIKNECLESVYCEDNSVIADVYDKDCDEYPEPDELKGMVEIY